MLVILLVAGALALSACGSDPDPAPVVGAAPSAETTTGAATATTGRSVDGAAAEDEAGDRGDGTRIELGDSEFGEMLFDDRNQAIYIFENDPKGETVCYGECAEAWPPVYTEGEPVAGDGVDDALLGTLKRRDGRLQVTYAGRPLYFYVNEDPGEVRCHNVNLNGGLWWVVGADGKRLP